MAVVAAAFTGHAVAALPAQPDPVDVLGIDEIRRGRPRWVFDEAAGSWVTVRDRWHVGSAICPGGQGLLGRVEGRNAQVVIDWLAARDRSWRDHGLKPVRLAVEAVNESWPDLLTFTETERQQRAYNRHAACEEAVAAAKAAVRAGDLGAALAALDRGEAVDPDHRVDGFRT